MANQPTKYRKFVVGAASAALVASAVAPVAFAAEFTDVKDNNSHKAAIDALSDAGVISGYPDGTFQPNKTLTRSDVVKLMGKWLVAEGYKVPTDYKTKPRFSDLKTTSNDELLKMSALVYDNGVFVGKPDGSLDAAGDITRENMAIVLVRAFDRVYDVDLVSYVKGQTDFNKDVTDLGKAKAEARPAIDVLDFFDITNPAAPEFNPKATTTRGQFASFLYKTTKVDFDQIGGEVVAPGVASVKAVNATTVEVTMKDKVTNIDSLKFTIDGLTVSNAAVKQSDDKTVVLTTAVQKGAEKYTVKLNDKAIGNFVGISNVVPDKISLNTKSVQGVVGQQVILSADIGVKEAGVAVTFNVKANTTGTLNKDQVFEAVTNADGIATFSYTQYSAGNDTVTVYPTGNAAVREQGMVYWASASQLTVKDITEATTLSNGSKKVYEINSARNAGGYVFVTFKENMGVTPDKLVKTVNAQGVTTYELNAAGVPTIALGATAYPFKASTGGENVIAVKLDAAGKANLVLSGSNATATPIVYEGKALVTNPTTQTDYNAKYDATARQATANPVTFTVEHALGLTVKAEGVQNAATWKSATEMGGRDYTVNYTDKDGKLAAKGTVVRVAIPKAGLATDAGFKMYNKAGVEILEASNDATYKYYNVTLEEAGKATFTVASANLNDYVAPAVFVENGSTPGLDKNDLQVVAETTYFVNTVGYAAQLKAKDASGKEITSLRQGEVASFTYELVDQNGKPRSAGTNTTVSFQVKAGTGDLVATAPGVTQPVQAGATKTVNAVITAGNTTTDVKVTALAPSSAEVTATGSREGVVLPSTNPASVSVNFTATSNEATAKGNVLYINNADDKVVIYNNATGKTFSYSFAKADVAEYYVAGTSSNYEDFKASLVAGDEIEVSTLSNGKLVLKNTKETAATTLKADNQAAFNTIINALPENATESIDVTNFTGDLEINTNKTATITLTATAPKTITNVNVKAPNATVNQGANITVTNLNIIDVSSNSYVVAANATVQNVTITDPNGARFVNNGTAPANVVVNTDKLVKLGGNKADKVAVTAPNAKIEVNSSVQLVITSQATGTSVTKSDTAAAPKLQAEAGKGGFTENTAGDVTIVDTKGAQTITFTTTEAITLGDKVVSVEGIPTGTVAKTAATNEYIITFNEGNVAPTKAFVAEIDGQNFTVVPTSENTWSAKVAPQNGTATITAQPINTTQGADDILTSPQGSYNVAFSLTSQDGATNIKDLADLKLELLDANGNVLATNSMKNTKDNADKDKTGTTVSFHIGQESRYGVSAWNMSPYLNTITVPSKVRATYTIGEKTYSKTKEVSLTKPTTTYSATDVEVAKYIVNRYGKNTGVQENGTFELIGFPGYTATHKGIFGSTNFITVEIKNPNQNVVASVLLRNDK